LDHLVLPVASLDIARRRYKALGFNVAADARHPFGTENCCIYFADGTYLEPLGIAQRETCEAAAIKGNTFVARDQAYRFRNPGDGFSAIAFGTDDAKSLHKQYVRQGISAGAVLNFKRQITDGSGQSQEISFSTAFAGDLRSPDLFFLGCQRNNVPDLDFGELNRHRNGVKAICEIVLTESNPSDFQYLLQDVIAQRDQNAHSFGIEIKSGNANVAVLSPVGMSAWFGSQTVSGERGLIGRAVVFGVTNPARTREVLDAGKVEFREIANRIVVAPASGQGVILAFEAMK
jgi:hypothetical protein